MVNPSRYAQSVKVGRTLGWLIAAVALFVVVGPVIEDCSKMPGTPRLQVGQRVIFQMAGRQNLRQVGFFETYPNARPSDFLRLISDRSNPLWPKEAGAQKLHDEVRLAGDRILAPDELDFSIEAQRHTGRDELVVRADDANQKIIVVGYVAGQSEPAFEYVWDFPTTAGKVPLGR